MAIKRRTILDALVTRLQGIDGTGSYSTDLDGRVWLRRVTPLQQNELPGIVVLDPSDAPIGEGVQGPNNVIDWLLTVEVHLKVKPGTIDAQNIDQLIKDVYVAIGVDDRFDGNVLELTLAGDELDIEQEEKIIHGAIITLQMRYRTNKYAES